MRVFFLYFAALVASTVSAAQPISSPTTDIPPGTHLLLQAKGEGVQIYACANEKWMLKAPDARLLDDQGKIIGTHSAGPTWKLTDGSEVKGAPIGNRPAPQPDSIPWLLLQAVPGSGSGKFADVAYIRRTQTHGGTAPKTSCTGGESREPYTAVYSFYSKD